MLLLPTWAEILVDQIGHRPIWWWTPSSQHDNHMPLMLPCWETKGPWATWACHRPDPTDKTVHRPNATCSPTGSFALYMGSYFISSLETQCLPEALGVYISKKEKKCRSSLTAWVQWVMFNHVGWENNANALLEQYVVCSNNSLKGTVIQ